MGRFSRLLLIVVSMVAPLTASSAAPTIVDPLLTPAQLAEDVAILRRVLEENQVGLNWFLPPADYVRSIRAIEQRTRQPMRARDFHKLLLPLIVSLRHGHSTIERPVAAAGFRLRQLDKDGLYFPFEERPIGGRLFILSDLSGEQRVGRGAEIRSIDGVPAAVLLKRMEAMLSADGDNRTFKHYQLGEGWRFSDLLDLIGGPATRYRLAVRKAGARRYQTIEVAALAPDAIGKRFAEQRGQGIDTYPPAAEYRSLGNGVALVGAHSFYEGLLPKGSAGFEAEYRKIFAQVAANKVGHLIIDVRGNEGGNVEVAAMLYAFVADRPFAFAGRSFIAKPALSMLSHVDNPSDINRAFAATPEAFVERGSDGVVRLKPEYDTDRTRTFQPRPEAYKGRLTILTDGGSFSATNDFIDLVARFHRREGRPVRFVGEQNGGTNAFRYASGAQIRFRLPNSRELLAVPSIAAPTYFGTATPPVVIPDRVVVPSIADQIAGIDRALIVAQQADRTASR